MVVLAVFDAHQIDEGSPRLPDALGQYAHYVMLPVAGFYIYAYNRAQKGLRPHYL